jgi:hypothetical protein
MAGAMSSGKTDAGNGTTVGSAGKSGAAGTSGGSAGKSGAATLPVNLGSAANYVILAKSGISTVPTSAVTGNL